MLPLADPRSWRAESIDRPETWYHSLSPRALAALLPVVRSWNAGTLPITDLHLSPDLRAVCADDIVPVRTDLEAGRGFSVLRAGTPGEYTAQDLVGMYWLVGLLLGRPIAQNVQGVMLYDVRDTGQDVRYGARFSVTNAESTYHTDNSFGEDVLDYVGLLCLNSARSGGESRIVSGHAVREELKARDPGALDLLRQPFHVDRRGGLRPGDAPTIPFPVFGGDDREPVIRYLRYWIEVGQEKVGAPLRPEQMQALDLLDRIAEDPAFRVEFTLRPGEMLFVNNRWILHNRTAFEDWPEPERRRHYVRLWVERDGIARARHACR